MPISGATLLYGGTVSVAGGTSKTFSEVGESIKNGKKVTDLSVVDARIRPTITCVNRPASLNSLGMYISKDKRTAKLVQPKVTTSGALVFNVREIRAEDHPETTDAEKVVLDSYAAQLLSDSDFTQFFRNGSIA